MRGWLRSEDWWSVWVGLLVFLLSLGVLGGADLLGWGVATKEWVDLGKALAPASKTYAGLPPGLCLLLTYLFLLAVLTAGAAVMRLNVGRFAVSFSVVFWLSYLCLLLGNWAYIATTPDKRAAFGISWSVGLTGEAGYVIALLAGLFIGNLLPGVAAWLKEGARAEWFVKTAIVLLGATFAVKAVNDPKLTSAILFRGFAAIVEAYLIYWALVYLVARTVFRFSREWAAPLASGIAICGVSAAIATGAAIRARPVVPVMVSSLVVVFAVLELLVLPFAAQTFLAHEPMVAAAWMGLAVKTDGAAVASGAIADGLLHGHGWVRDTTAAVKVFIDIFIGIWAFVLGTVWVYWIDKRKGETVRVIEIWERFPKFILGYVLTFVAALLACLYLPGVREGFNQAKGESEVFRTLFFVMTFFSIGLAAHFRRLWEEGIGRLVAVYVLCLFGFILWIGLGISWVFFHGVYPPAGG